MKKILDDMSRSEHSTQRSTENSPYKNHCGEDIVAVLAHSHSMVAGGLDEISKHTRLMPFTSLMIRVDTFPSTS